MASYKIPQWMSVWLVFTGLICLWDAAFVVVRPHSLPGGKWNAFWNPYNIYIAVDTRYADMTDTFVYAQSLMNFVEVALDFLAVWLSLKNSRSSSAVAFTVSVMTMWKTVLYMLQYLECIGGGEFHSHSSTTDTVLMLWIPAAIWIGVPLLAMLTLWQRLVPPASNRAKHD